MERGDNPMSAGNAGLGTEVAALFVQFALLLCGLSFQVGQSTRERCIVSRSPRDINLQCGRGTWGYSII